MKILKEYRFKQNPLEQNFVEQFIKDYGCHKNMSSIVFGSNERGHPREWLTDRDDSIVLSTIQWLGSPVGQSFLKSIKNEKELKY